MCGKPMVWVCLSLLGWLVGVSGRLLPTTGWLLAIAVGVGDGFVFVFIRIGIWVGLGLMALHSLIA